MKKLISSILIIVIVSSIFLPKISLAYEGTGQTTMEDATVNYDTFKEDSENGSSSVGGSSEKKAYQVEDGTVNSVIKNVVKVFNIIPSFARLFMTIVTLDTSTDEANKEYGTEFSIQKLVFNKVNIFDANFFATSAEDVDLQKNVKDAVALVYYTIRDLAIVGILVVLIYTGIRMAIASLGAEKAKYKTMLVNWIIGFVLLMFLPYIMIIILQISSFLLDLCEAILTALCGDSIKNIENTILENSTTSTEKGFSILIPTLVYWIITFFQVKFFIIYGKRLFNTAFLVVISPLVLVQYVFDKAGDNQGESFKTWLREYSVNVLIQPLHATLYMVFMVMASNIVKEAPILAVIFLASLSRGEKILRNIIGVKKTQTVQGMKDTFNAKKISGKIGK